VFGFGVRADRGRIGLKADREPNLNTNREARTEKRERYSRHQTRANAATSARLTKTSTIARRYSSLA
jgi:hypothetical protein